MINDLRKSLLDLDRLPSIPWYSAGHLGISLHHHPAGGYFCATVWCFLYHVSHLFPCFGGVYPPVVFEKVWEKNYLDLEYLSMSVFCYSYWIKCWVKNSSGNHFLSKFRRLSSVNYWEVHSNFGFFYVVFFFSPWKCSFLLFCPRVLKLYNIHCWGLFS